MIFGFDPIVKSPKKSIRVQGAYNPFSDPQSAYNNPDKGPHKGSPDDLFPDSIPIDGDLTPEQQAWLDKRSSFARIASAADQVLDEHYDSLWSEADFVKSATDYYNADDGRPACAVCGAGLNGNTDDGWTDDAGSKGGRGDHLHMPQYKFSSRKTATGKCPHCGFEGCEAGSGRCPGCNYQLQWDILNFDGDPVEAYDDGKVGSRKVAENEPDCEHGGPCKWGKDRGSCPFCGRYPDEDPSRATATRKVGYDHPWTDPASGGLSDPGFGQIYGDASTPSYVTPDDQEVWMYRKGQSVRFYTRDGKQVGPEQSNVAPAAAYALSNGWRDPFLMGMPMNPDDPNLPNLATRKNAKNRDQAYFAGYQDGGKKTFNQEYIDDPDYIRGFAMGSGKTPAFASRKVGTEEADVFYGGDPADGGVGLKYVDADHEAVYNGLGTDGVCEVCGKAVLFDGFGPGDPLDENTKVKWQHIRGLQASRKNSHYQVDWNGDEYSEGFNDGRRGRPPAEFRDSEKYLEGWDDGDLQLGPRTADFGPYPLKCRDCGKGFGHPAPHNGPIIICPYCGSYEVHYTSPRKGSRKVAGVDESIMLCRGYEDGYHGKTHSLPEDPGDPFYYDNGYVMGRDDHKNGKSPSMKCGPNYTRLGSRKFATATSPGYYLTSASGATISGPYPTPSEALAEVAKNKGSAVEYKSGVEDPQWDLMKGKKFPPGSNTINGSRKVGGSYEECPSCQGGYPATKESRDCKRCGGSGCVCKNCKAQREYDSKHASRKTAAPPHTDTICAGSGKVDNGDSHCPVCGQESPDGWHTKDGWVRKWHSDPSGKTGSRKVAGWVTDPGYNDSSIGGDQIFDQGSSRGCVWHSIEGGWGWSIGGPIDEDGEWEDSAEDSISGTADDESSAKRQVEKYLNKSASRKLAIVPVNIDDHLEEGEEWPYDAVEQLENPFGGFNSYDDDVLEDNYDDEPTALPPAGYNAFTASRRFAVDYTHTLSNQVQWRVAFDEPSVSEFETPKDQTASPSGGNVAVPRDYDTYDMDNVTDYNGVTPPTFENQETIGVS